MPNFLDIPTTEPAIIELDPLLEEVIPDPMEVVYEND